MTKTRIYLVSVDDGSSYLVEATTQAQALRHVARNLIQCSVANTKQVAELVGRGVRVETAGDDQDTADMFESAESSEPAPTNKAKGKGEANASA